ncbi:PREDICTED: protein phosphatase inhibitor 2-like [Amphimedon queenslandica]|uniref:Protein phosphatase inhibitor 2 n=1 Tax=Amphimedon queenslandica TaxID=400682 RepID=A0A1X7UZP1_AMPQE|nr:PREDICTED: protein phosphatase inhibitor 2-like [Amphimedon queenslandica]XP_019851337.1 PREDICTED: protein phosphatase inhibitor 2-like [Amphimedon queenslandica]|eukprot:XP_011403593.1 PREDICTED: protein phosphatase inhibitor 2-like [Amphimedon queenslandica]
MAEAGSGPVIRIEGQEEDEKNKESRDDGGEPARGILKKRGRVITPEERAKRVSASIQWDEMNILATEHPPDKDYGHMKIEEPKTPYHEMVEEESESKDIPGVTPEDVAQHVINKGEIKSKWEDEDGAITDDEMLSEEEKVKKREFREWRKAHYNEFAAVQRARELMKEDEEELRRLEEEEGGGGGDEGMEIQ